MAERRSYNEQSFNDYFYVLLEISRARALAGVSVGWHEKGADSPDVKLDYFGHQNVQPREHHVLTEGQELQLANIILLVKFLDEAEINGKEIRSILMKMWPVNDAPRPSAQEINRPVKVMGVARDYPAWVIDRATRLVNRRSTQVNADAWESAIGVILKAVNAQRYATDAGPEDWGWAGVRG